MDKENVPEPHGILKKLGAESLGVTQRYLLPMTESRIARMSRRRVSFAPEVTLHKIDFIPQYRSDSYDVDGGSGPRRETIACIPSSQESESAESDDHESAEQRLLSDSSDDDDDLPANEDEDTAPIQMEIPIPLDASFANDSMMERPETKSFGEAQADKNNDSGEEDMELTDTVGQDGILVGRESILNVSVAQLNTISANVDQDVDSGGKFPVEFSPKQEPLQHRDLQQPDTDQGVTPQVESQDHTESMELTEQMEVTEHLGYIDHSKHANQEEDMELTQSLGVVKSATDPIEEEEDDMELTQPVGSVKTVSKTVATPGGEDELSPPPPPPTNEAADQLDMELTQTVGQVNAQHHEQYVPENNPHEVNNHESIDVSRLSPNVPHLDSIPNLTKADSQAKLINNPERKRSLDDAIEFSSKIVKPNSIQNEVATTSTVPLADVTNESFDESSMMENPVTLSQFMKDIGIKFYDDLGIGSQRPNRISINLPNQKQEQHSLADYTVGAIQIPTYELYEFSCSELMKNIQESIRVFDQLDQNTSYLNPRLFKEFYETIPDAQLGMKSEFQLIKDYARHEAKRVWYKWRIQLYDNLNEELETLHNSLKIDKEKTIQGLSKIDQVTEVLKTKHTQLKSKLLGFRVLVENCNEMAPDDIEKSKQEIVQLKQHIDQFKKECLQQSIVLNELNESIHAKEAAMAKLNEQIYQHKLTLKRNKRYNTKEVRDLELSFQLLEGVTQCKYMLLERKSLQILYDDQVEVSFKLGEDISSICYHVNEDSIKLRNTQLCQLALKLAREIDTTKPVLDQFQEFRKIWQHFRELDTCIYKILLKYPVEICNTEVKVRFLLRELECKLELLIELLWLKENVTSTPTLSIKAQKMKAAVDSKRLILVLQTECKNNWLVSNLRNVSWLEI